MTQHDPLIALDQMLHYSRLALRFGGGLSASDIVHDDLRAMAILHALEYVGEAANRLSAAEQQGWPAIPWRPIIDMRYRIAHGYDSVDYERVAQTIREDLPPLIAALAAILEGEDGGQSG